MPVLPDHYFCTPGMSSRPVGAVFRSASILPMARPLRVLMTCYEFPPLAGGGSQVVRGLTNELSALGHSVEQVTMRHGELHRVEVIGGVTVHRVPCVRFRVAICTPPELLSYLLGAWPVVVGPRRSSSHRGTRQRFALRSSNCRLIRLLATHWVEPHIHECTDYFLGALSPTDMWRHMSVSCTPRGPKRHYIAACGALTCTFV